MIKNECFINDLSSKDKKDYNSAFLYGMEADFKPDLISYFKSQ